MVEWKDDPVVRFRRIESLYQAALELPEIERPAYLDKECSDDISLRREVEKLLAARSEAGNFLSIPAIEIEAGRHSDETQDVVSRSGFASWLNGGKIETMSGLGYAYALGAEVTMRAGSSKCSTSEWRRSSSPTNSPSFTPASAIAQRRWVCSKELTGYMTRLS